MKVVGGCVLFTVICVGFVSAGAIVEDANKVADTDSFGDTYLERAGRDCKIKRNPFLCAKFRALRYVHDLTTPAPDSSVTIWGPLRLVSITPPANVLSIFPESAARTSDSDFVQAYKYVTRQMDKMVSSHALSWTLGGLGQDDASLRIVDDERPDVQLGMENKRPAKDKLLKDGRGKKKKVAILLPLLLFFKLKAILIPILLSVLFIKKLLVIGAFLIPSFLSYFKHHDHHDKVLHGHDFHDSSSEYSSPYESYSSPHKDYVKRSSNNVKRQAQYMAYQNYYDQLNQGSKA